MVHDIVHFLWRSFTLTMCLRTREAKIVDILANLNTSRGSYSNVNVFLPPAVYPIFKY